MTQEKPEQTITDKIEQASIAFRFLSLLERVLPAFLVAWANHYKARNKELEAQLVLAKVNADIVEKKHASEKEELTSKPVDVIDSFLND